MKRILILLALALALPSCSVLEYGAVQRQFERAVQADNRQAVSPFTDAGADFSELLAELKPSYIAELDPRVQPNAWMLRGICAWRSRKYAVARDASTKGLALSNLVAGSRDAVILKMLPGLVFAAQTADTWRSLEAQNEAEYENLKVDMRSAWAELNAAESAMNSSTPRSTKSYLYYHRWKIALAWAAMIQNATPDTTKQSAMNTWTHTDGGVASTRLVLEADKAAALVSGPLRELIEALE